MTNHTHETETISLLERTATSIMVDTMIAQSGGFMYSWNFAPHVRWEVTTADPRSNKVCVRYQSRIYWIHKPWLTWRVLEKNAYNHLHELSNNLE